MLDDTLKLFAIFPDRQEWYYLYSKNVVVGRIILSICSKYIIEVT